MALNLSLEQHRDFSTNPYKTLWTYKHTSFSLEFQRLAHEWKWLLKSPIQEVQTGDVNNPIQISSIRMHSPSAINGSVCSNPIRFQCNINIKESPRRFRRSTCRRLLKRRNKTKANKQAIKRHRAAGSSSVCEVWGLSSFIMTPRDRGGESADDAFRVSLVGRRGTEQAGIRDSQAHYHVPQSLGVHGRLLASVLAIWSSENDSICMCYYLQAKFSPGILIDSKQSNSTLTGRLRLVLSCQRRASGTKKNK